jgi:restriction system protein
MTVCQIKRNNAEERVRAMLEGRRIEPPLPLEDEEAGSQETGYIDLEEFARDLIRQHIGRRFKGGDLERLVTAVLEAQGYRAKAAPVGADGGVDIVAGRGTMGFDSPRLVVQVKSSESPQDVRVLRELQGVMSSFGAEQGLLVSWGGYTRSVDREARQLFFRVRLWDADDLVDSLLDNYDELPADLQAEIPLKMVWALVPDED